MRLGQPRIAPKPQEEWTEEEAQLIGRTEQDGFIFNIFRTMVHHFPLYKRWIPFANHVLFKSTLSPRDRELAILRIGYLCRSGYEFAQHVEIALRSDITKDEIDRVCDGPDAPGWAENEVALLRATDELKADTFISDATWALLKKHYADQQIMDLVFAVGQYNLVSMALNTFGVQLDDFLEPHPRLKG